MWEDLTIALCALGFTAVVAVLLVELPAVLKPVLKPVSRLRGDRITGHGHH
ncbi:hypothetical protein ACTXG6_18945 [Pseudonocardia sp. Cha107L01]|uniref:hypothetical protein n=1 Tax=Pseudonocardia sp. Cha107L01 TaxID=3457576 RepID=UPI00403E8707